MSYLPEVFQDSAMPATQAATYFLAQNWLFLGTNENLSPFLKSFTQPASRRFQTALTLTECQETTSSLTLPRKGACSCQPSCGKPGSCSSRASLVLSNIVFTRKAEDEGWNSSNTAPASWPTQSLIRRRKASALTFCFPIPVIAQKGCKNRD